MNSAFFKRIALALAIGLIAAPANANVVISGTRVIYPATAREVTVKLNNEGAMPVLVQTWIDDGDASAGAQQRPMPFSLTPPVFRIDPARGQMLRVTYSGEPLPADRESVYWLNVLEIPPKAQVSDEESKLQLAFRTRIKLFFRPAGLPGEADAAAAKLDWSFAQAANGGGKVALLAKNPTPYHVSVTQASVQIDGQTHASAPGMIAPLEEREFVLEGLRQIPQEAARIRFETINDYGANVPAAFPPDEH